MTMFGGYPMARRPLATLPSMPVLTTAVLTAAGVGSLSVVSGTAGPALTVATMSGSGAFAPTAGFKAVFTSSGVGAFNAVMGQLPATAVFAGYGAAFFESYLFLPDVEVAAPPEEPRCAYVEAENNAVVVPSEDRSYDAGTQPPPVGPPNRRRMV